jgi:hypothetical protein
MESGILFSELELGYAPMNAYHFKNLISEKGFHKNVEDSHIYIIAQRKEITFNNIQCPNDKEIRTEIRQEGSSKSIICSIPAFQKNITTDKTKPINVVLYNRKGRRTGTPEKAQALSFVEMDKENNQKLLIWFSPEKLLQNYWKGNIETTISGDFKELLNYKVLYVGKSTEQNICARLSNHSTFQDILTSEEALSYGNIPSNEIVIMLFRIKDNNSLVKWGKESTGKDISNFIHNYSLPDVKTVSLDAEKALIQHLQPGYNKIMYNSYPNKSDLINKDPHSVFLYSFTDPITLIYEEGIIKGDEFIERRNFISVKSK